MSEYWWELSEEYEYTCVFLFVCEWLLRQKKQKSHFTAVFFRQPFFSTCTYYVVWYCLPLSISFNYFILFCEFLESFSEYRCPILLVLWFASCYSVFYMNLLQIPCRSLEKREFTIVLLLFFFLSVLRSTIRVVFFTISTFSRDCFFFFFFRFSLLISLKSGSKTDLCLCMYDFVSFVVYQEYSNQRLFYFYIFHFSR